VARKGQGEGWVWFTGSALGVCLLMVGGLVALILVHGLGFFWPDRLERVTLKDGSVFLGEPVAREPIPAPGTPEHHQRHRIQLKVGNRDLLGFDFKWIDEDQIASRDHPPDAYYVERREYGPLLGAPLQLVQGGQVTAQGSAAVGQALPALLGQAKKDRAALEEIEKDDIGDINYRI
jgi:phosphate transport system permease protein